MIKGGAVRLTASVSIYLLSILFSVLYSVFVAAALPGPEHLYLNDFANMIPDQEEARLRTELADLDRRYGIEFVVVTVDSYAQYSKQYRDVEGFAQHLFDDWGVGLMAESRGVLLVITRGAEVIILTSEPYPSHVRAELERIIDQVIVLPVKRQKPASGVIDGIEALIAVIEQKSQTLGWFQWHFVILGVFLLSLPLAMKLNERRYLPWYLLLPALPGFILIGLFENRDGSEALFDFGLSDSGGGDADGGGD
jgi:hypothetical protein